jgi:predicted ArsR family transcriptional regulator
VNLLWTRADGTAESTSASIERRVRDFIESPGGISESAESLADKMGISRRRCQRILDGLVAEGVLQRREYADMQPMYVRFPNR